MANFDLPFQFDTLSLSNSFSISQPTRQESIELKKARRLALKRNKIRTENDLLSNLRRMAVTSTNTNRDNQLIVQRHVSFDNTNKALTFKRLVDINSFISLVQKQPLSITIKREQYDDEAPSFPFSAEHLLKIKCYAPKIKHLIVDSTSSPFNPNNKIAPEDAAAYFKPLLNLKTLIFQDSSFSFDIRDFHFPFDTLFQSIGSENLQHLHIDTTDKEGSVTQKSLEKLRKRERLIKLSLNIHLTMPTLSQILDQFPHLQCLKSFSEETPILDIDTLNDLANDFPIEKQLNLFFTYNIDDFDEDLENEEFRKELNIYYNEDLESYAFGEEQQIILSFDQDRSPIGIE